MICGLTFLINGCQILGEENCNSVDIGGNRRVISYTCHWSPNAGEMSGGTAGGLGVAIGLGMILIAVAPAIRNAMENRQISSGGGNYRPYTPPSQPPPRTQQRPPTPPRDPPKPSRPALCANPDCKKELRATAKFCGHCGTKVP